MSNTLDQFISLFLTEQRKEIEETFLELKIVLKTTDLISIPTSNDISNCITFLNRRDSLKISILIEEEDSIDYYSSNNPESFIKELSNRIDIIEDGQEIEIQFVITKNKVEGVLSVYLLDNLYKYLIGLDLTGILYTINSAFSTDDYLLLESQFDTINVKTNSLWLGDKNTSEFKSNSLIPRTEKINSAKTICNFNLLNQYEFIPNDFYVIESSSQLYKNLFNRIGVVYSVAYLYDITTIEKSIVAYKLNGYKSIKGEINFSEIEHELVDEYYKIYDWCYNGGNFIDKIGLARNIISLHLEKPVKIELKGSPYQAIQSSFKVYEKQNIKQYIEIRNKISEQLLGFHDRANKIIETFASGFQKSALALISFYISAILLKLLGKSDLQNIFTLDATILSMAFVGCSYIYFYVSLWEVKEQRKRFVSSYNNLKERYLDLLDSVDIKRILNDDKEFNSDLKFIDDKQKRYSRMWQGYLLILAFVTLILFLFYNISHLLNSRIWNYLFGTCNSCN